MRLIKEQILNVMSFYFGATAPFLLEKTLARLNITDLYITVDKKNELIDVLISEVFSTIASEQKLKLIRSQLESIFNNEI